MIGGCALTLVTNHGVLHVHSTVLRYLTPSLSIPACHLPVCYGVNAFAA